jgi:hypothetical protein
MGARAAGVRAPADAGPSARAAFNSTQLLPNQSSTKELLWP